LLSPLTNIIMRYLERDRDVEEAGLNAIQDDEPTANYVESSMLEYNSFQQYDNSQSLDVQARASETPRYTNDDNY